VARQVDRLLAKRGEMLNAENITPTKQQIVAIKSRNPLATNHQIAEDANCSPQYVSKVLQDYGLTREIISNYKRNRVSILQGLQARILSKISDEDIQKASLQQKVTAVGIIHDKERELEGFGRETMPMVVINKITVEGNQDRSEIIDVQSVVNSTQEASIIQQKNKPLEMIDENS
jgi:glutaredoxin